MVLAVLCIMLLWRSDIHTYVYNDVLAERELLGFLISLEFHFQLMLM